MKAIRIHGFGAPEAMMLEDVPNPAPNAGEVVIEVEAAGVGPWDALIRNGKSVLAQPLPLTPGGELSGIIDSMGPGVEGFKVGDEVFGVTNRQLTGAYAEYAVADARTIAAKPKSLNYTHAASVPIAALTAWQMIFDSARPLPGQTLLIHGGAGNVGAYAVQFARDAGARVIVTASAADVDYVRSRGALGVIDYRASRFEEKVKEVDAVIDTVGGEILDRSYGVVKRGGMVVSAAAQPSQEKAEEHGVRSMFCRVQVTGDRLRNIAEIIDAGRIKTEVGEVLFLAEARRGHEMLEGAPHRRGKIVIKVKRG